MAIVKRGGRTKQNNNKYLPNLLVVVVVVASKSRIRYYEKKEVGVSDLTLLSKLLMKQLMKIYIKDL